VKSRRSIIALAAALVTVLSACGASAPPARELATEMVDTMVERGDITEAAATCMREEIEDFSLTEEQAQGFSDFDDVASKAAKENELALQILRDFQAALAACN
jgi:polyhydroxyalkanoate synthesis regulator phasin